MQTAEGYPFAADSFHRTDRQERGKTTTAREETLEGMEDATTSTCTAATSSLKKSGRRVAFLIDGEVSQTRQWPQAPTPGEAVARSPSWSRAEVEALREMAEQRGEDVARVASVLGYEVVSHTPTPELTGWERIVSPEQCHHGHFGITRNDAAPTHQDQEDRLRHRAVEGGEELAGMTTASRIATLLHEPTHHIELNDGHNVSIPPTLRGEDSPRPLEISGPLRRLPISLSAATSYAPSQQENTATGEHSTGDSRQPSSVRGEGSWSSAARVEVEGPMEGYSSPDGGSNVLSDIGSPVDNVLIPFSGPPTAMEADAVTNGAVALEHHRARTVPGDANLADPFSEATSPPSNPFGFSPLTQNIGVSALDAVAPLSLVNASTGVEDGAEEPMTFVHDLRLDASSSRQSFSPLSRNSLTPLPNGMNHFGEETARVESHRGSLTSGTNVSLPSDVTSVAPVQPINVPGITATLSSSFNGRGLQRMIH